MKKIYLFIAACMVSAMSLAQEPVLTASDLDFGTVDLTEASMGKATLHVEWANLPIYSQVEMAVVNVSDEDHCIFAVDEKDTTFVWTGSGVPYDPYVYSYDCEVSYQVDAAGDYSCQIHIYVYDPENTKEYVIVAEKTVNVTLKVTNTPTAIGNTAAEVKAQKMLRDGQVLIVRNGNTYTVTGSRVR